MYFTVLPENVYMNQSGTFGYKRGKQLYMSLGNLSHFCQCDLLSKVLFRHVTSYHYLLKSLYFYISYELFIILR